LADLKQQEEELKNFCNALPSERNVANKFSYDSTDNLSSVEDSDDDDYLEGALYIPETDAVITIQSAIPLLHRYCLALPADDYFHPRPVFEFDSYDTGYSCCLRLPSNTPFNVLRSHIASSKSRAKALVSLEACKKLRSLNCLDKHLKPFDYRTEILGDMAPETDSNGMVIGSKRRHNMYEKRTPQLWERHEDIDDEVIQVEDDADLLKARKNKDVENLEINKQINPVEKSDDPFEVLLATDETLNLDTPTPHFDPDGDLIMFDDDETITESTRDNAADESFCYWASIVEIMTQDDKINELPYRQLCILTRKPMPALPQICLFDRSKPIHVTIHAINIGITLEQERLSHLCRYMLNVMKSLLNKEFTCDPKDTPYFTVPLVHGNINQSYQTLTKDDLEKLIDWVEIDSIVQLKKEEFTLDSEESLDDVILIDYSNSERRYRFEKIHHDLNLTSPVPTDHTVRESGYTSFQDYYTQKDRKIPVNIDNPMVLGRQVKRRLNYITTSSLVESKIKGGAYGWLAPEFCKKYHMHLSVFQALLVVPSIMIRIDSLLLLNEAKTKFDLHIDDQLMLEAYTTASACMEMNYERLEILGGKPL
jgi:hypothetical protein